MLNPPWLRFKKICKFESEDKFVKGNPNLVQTIDEHHPLPLPQKIASKEIFSKKNDLKRRTEVRLTDRFNLFYYSMMKRILIGTNTKSKMFFRI
jgi:hypothetical protein